MLTMDENLMWNCKIWLRTITTIFASMNLYAKEIVPIDQYNALAQKYTALFLDQDQENIIRYFHYFDFPLEGKKVLDVGCGNGHDLSQIKQRGALIYGMDASEKMVLLAKQANEEGEIEIGCFEHIPFPDHFFDVIMSKWALQTATDIDAVYREIARVAKPNAQLVYLSAHPIRQFIEKKRKGKNYFLQEIVESVFFDGQITVKEPSHTMNEYLSPTFFQYFTLEAYEEGFGSGAEKVDMDIYPSYIIIKAKLK